jgi:hypothetical protein
MERSVVDRLRAVARKQRGMFTLAQALQAGWNRRSLHRALAHGLLETTAPRVYRFSPAPPLSWLDRICAAALSADGAAARRSACALYELCKPPSTPEVLVTRTRRNLDRVVLHSTLSLPATDLTRVRGVRATTAARSMIDAGTDVTMPIVVAMVDDAVVRQLVHPLALERRARELVAPARPGAARVLHALATRHPDLERARNKWEARVLRLAQRYRLPDPIPNYVVHLDGQRRILDAAWPVPMVFLEFDGFLPHMGRGIFDDDRARQNALIDAGWLPFRLTSAMLGRDAARHFDAIARAIATRSVSHELVADGQNQGHSDRMVS